MSKPRLHPDLVSRVRELFAEVDDCIGSGDWSGPAFDPLLEALQSAIIEAYGPSSQPIVAHPRPCPSEPGPQSFDAVVGRDQLAR